MSTHSNEIVSGGCKCHSLLGMFPVPKGREVRVNEKCFPAAPGPRPQGTEKYSDKSGLISEQKS